MSDRPFELFVVADRPDEYGLALFQEPRAENGKRRRPRKNVPWPLVVRIAGTPLRAVMDQVLQTLRENGYRPSDLSRSRKTPFGLKEQSGVRLGLLLLGVKPLRKVSRMAEISEHIQATTDEEAYYWFSKATNPNYGRRYQKAFRILMARE